MVATLEGHTGTTQEPLTTDSKDSVASLPKQPLPLQEQSLLVLQQLKQQTRTSPSRQPSSRSSGALSSSTSCLSL